MGSVLRRQATALAPSPASANSSSQEQSIPSVENTAGYVQQGNGHGFAFSATSPEPLRLSPEQRARIDDHTAMALAKRREKLSKQQIQEEQLLLNWLTPVQTTLSSQQYNTLSSQQDNCLLSTALMSTHSPPSSQQDVYCGSTLGLENQDICGVSTLASTHSATHFHPDLHRDIDGSSILTSTYSAQTSQQDKHTALISVHNSRPLQQNNQGGLVSASVQNPSSSQQGSHGGLTLNSLCSHLPSQEHICHSGSAGNSSHCSLTLQHDGYVGSSLTLEQKARMACEREKALAKLKEKQKQKPHRSETRKCQCTIADRSTNFLLQKSYQNQTQTFSTAMLSQKPQGSYKGPSNSVQVLHRITSLQGPASSQQVAYSGSSLTKEQRVRMARQKEMAISRRKERLWQQQQDEYHHTHLTYPQCLASSQRNTYSGLSLTQEQGDYMAHQQQIAIARCNAGLQQQQQDEHHHMHHEPPKSKQGTAGVCMKSASDLLTNCVVDCSQSASLTQEQRARMARQKDMAIARRNARLRQQQQLDEHYHMQHKGPNSKQGTAKVGMNSQEFVTDLLPNCAVGCSQPASNQGNGASLFQQEGAVSPSLHQQISSQQDVQSYYSSQTNSDVGFSFTPAEKSLSSQEDSYSKTFSLCSEECVSTLFSSLKLG